MVVERSGSIATKSLRHDIVTERDRCVAIPS
jgi:hypothetical protein